MRLTLFCAHSDLVTHLTEEVAFWRTQYEQEREFWREKFEAVRASAAHERSRAEQAINELLRKAQATPLSVTPAPPPPMSAEEREIRRLMENPEFVSAGLVE